MLGSPLNDLSEVFDHKQVLAYDMHRSIKHPTAGSVQVPGRSMNLCEPSTKLDEHLPLLCEYNDQIPGQIGYRPEIDVFREDDVVWCVGCPFNSVSHPSLRSILDVLLLKNPTKCPLIVCHHLFDSLVIHLLAIEFRAQKLVLFPYFIFIPHIYYFEPAPLVISGPIGWPD